MANITSQILVCSHVWSISPHEKVIFGLAAMRVYMFTTGDAYSNAHMNV